MTRQATDVGLTLGILVLYILAIFQIGFFASSFVYLIAHMLLLGVRKPAMLLAIPIGVLLVLYAVIRLFLNVPMPRGILF